MAAEIIDGKAIAAKVREEVRRGVEGMSRKPGLATILVGDDPASGVYVRMKREDSAEVGIESFHHEPGGDVAAEELVRLIRGLNADERVDGILLQLPLPDHLDQDEFIALIDPAKDVDGLTTANAGLLMHSREEAIVPCTPAGVMRLLEETGVELSGARAVVLDVGTNRTQEGLVGDVDFEAAKERARAITPVPGGVGPMTRAMLLVNTLKAARARGG